MALQMYKVFFILTLLILSVDAKQRKHNRKSRHHHHNHKTPEVSPDINSFPRFPIPFPIFGGGTREPEPEPEPEPKPDLPSRGTDEFNDHENNLNDKENNNNNININVNRNETNVGVDDDEGFPKPDFETNFTGSWEVLSPQSGVSAMQINLMPTNKIIVYDATVYRTSWISYPPGVPCVPFQDDATGEIKQDCTAHSMEYDLATNQARPLKVTVDPWCSCGGLAPDGTLVSSGGFRDGAKTVRYFGGPTCHGNGCDWREYNETLKDERWYGTQTILPAGNFIVIGGRRSFSYEFLPTREGETTDKPYFFPFLYETSDIDENNLYPFVHLSTDGNLFIFSNNRSLLLNPTTNKVVRTFPVLPGGSRNYPASGMSVLLPLNLNDDDINNNGTSTLKAEVLVCGGNTYDAFYVAETQKKFIPALQDCNRMVISDPYPNWDTEVMPSRRSMGDALILPNGQILFINGAQTGTAAWGDADEPNLTPVLYNPELNKGGRFKEMSPTTIARMYHSTSAVIPNGKIWVGGSNTHGTYVNVDKFPTETRVEGFSPPYLDPNLNQFRPKIAKNMSDKDLVYGTNFITNFSINMADELTKNDIKVTMYFPPFTTHGVSMSQRLLILKIVGFVEDPKGVYSVTSVAPSSGKIAPPGHYLLFVVHRGVPGRGTWVRINGK